MFEGETGFLYQALCISRMNPLCKEWTMSSLFELEWEHVVNINIIRMLIVIYSCIVNMYEIVDTYSCPLLSIQG